MSAHRIQQIIDRIDLDRISPNNYASKNPSDASFHDMCVEEADFILSTLRPGEGLVGTFEEQAKYIETREAEANVEQNEAHSVQVGKKQESASLVDLLPDDVHEGVEGEELTIQSDDETLVDEEITEYKHSQVMVNGKMIPVSEYFGPAWVEIIHAHSNVPPMEVPANMTITPHDYQLKAAAQGLYNCKGRFKGMLLGDEMGLGKTLTAILLMYAMKDEPGMSLVICPASICKQWVEIINRAWKPGHGLVAVNLAAHKFKDVASIIALGCDVLVCSYEYFAYNGRNLRRAEAQMVRKHTDTTGTVRVPQRPTSILQSRVWEDSDNLFKVTVIDEAQKVNKRGGVRHEAIRQHCPTKSFFLMSGTLAHNKWMDVGGYPAFLKGHPFVSHQLFLHTFASWGHGGRIDAPNITQIRLLQRFLQAFTVARPASTLKLPDCHGHRILFNLNKKEEESSNSLYQSYSLAKQAVKTQSVKLKKSGKAAKKMHRDGKDESKKILAKAVRALMYSLHPLLGEEGEKGKIKVREDYDNEDGDLDLLGEEAANDLKGRIKWAETIEARKNLVSESGRLTTLIRLYEHLRQKHPGEKMIIFSCSRRFLDIVAVALARKHKVEAIRYDSTVPSQKRAYVEATAKEAHPQIPLLITITAGGVGLNLDWASIVIITEPQWNLSVQLQAIKRAHRQGQSKEVLWLLLVASNGNIDRNMLDVQYVKKKINDELMGGLFREPGEKPLIQDLLEISDIPTADVLRNLLS